MDGKNDHHDYPSRWQGSWVTVDGMILDRVRELGNIGWKRQVRG